MVKNKMSKYEDLDYEALHENFFDIDKESFLNYKELKLRLSSGYIDYDTIENSKEFYEKAVRFLTRTAYSLFSFITEENSPSIKFNLKSEGGSNALAHNRVEIGLKLLLNKKIPSQLKVDTITSTIYHEFYHKRYTNTDIAELLEIERNDFYKGYKKTEEHLKTFIKDETFKTIWNILEDKRIETLGAIDFPGYTFTFEESRKYCFFLHSGKDLLPPPYELYIIDFLLHAILIPELQEKFLVDYDKCFELLVKFSKEKKEITDKEIEDFEKSFKDVKEVFLLIKDYIAKNESLVFSKKYSDVAIAVEDIYNLIPKEIKDTINSELTANKTKQYIKISTAGSESFNEGDYEDADAELIEHLEKEISDELELMEKESKEEAKNQETKIEVHKINSSSKNNGFEEIEIIEDCIGITDTTLYNEAKVISKNICNNLGFLDSKFSRDIQTYELTEGEIDEDELYSISFDNRYIFQEVEDLPEYQLDFGILLDESGSMSSRIYEAKVATLSMILGLKDNKHINLFVYGHTANNSNRENNFSSNSNTIQIYKYYNTLEKVIDYRRIFNAKARANNADGYAIEKLAEIMSASKSRNKIMIVVSDGQPQASGYGGESAERHVKEVVDRLESDGITVIQVCMAYIENSPKMFKHFVPYEKSGEFFENLRKILLTKLTTFADSI